MTIPLETDQAHEERISRLRSCVPAILPSMLLCDFGDLAREVQRLEAGGVPCLHLDVMDGHFVPNLTYGMPIVDAFRRLTQLPLDAHLMIANPAQYVQQFADAGADMITIHAEAADDPAPILRKIRAAGADAGLAINPATPISAIERVLDLCNHILVMSVTPGFGGQAFEPVALEKLRQLRARLSSNVLLEVDGGVNLETIAACSQAGADLFVVGSAIFRNDDYSASIAQLRSLALSKRGS